MHGSMGQSMKTKAIYAGTFDPPTFGHLDVVKAAASMFDLVWLFCINPNKKPLIDLTTRLSAARAMLEAYQVEASIKSWEGLTVDYANSHNVAVLIRSFRSSTDIPYELEIEMNNSVLSPGVQTIFIPPKPESAHISSSMARILMAHRKYDQLRKYMPSTVMEVLIAHGYLPDC